MATLSITARTAGSAELIKTQALAVLMPERKTLATRAEGAGQAARRHSDEIFAKR
ncbi:MAG: hypothetical protein CM15mP89_5100 [Gammaproteobacteria bacterium]|nr:MAG: hypothetical protein CM15mP89_5100 [Gammaproteobacteria bacterium]